MDPEGFSPEAVRSTYVGPNRKKVSEGMQKTRKKKLQLIYNIGYIMLCSLVEQQIS
jgi:hypothetical protein